MRHRRHNTAERKPQPRQTRVTGVLDVIRHSTHSFSLKLEDRIEVRGSSKLASKLKNSRSSLAKSCWCSEGRYTGLRASCSGLMRRDSKRAKGNHFYLRRSPARATRPTPVRIEPSSRQRQGVPAFFGTWPGEETDEDFERMLAELRGRCTGESACATRGDTATPSCAGIMAQAGVPVPPEKK